MIIPEIRNNPERKLACRKLEMSFAEDKTPELWRSFMPVRNQIQNRLGDDVISMQLFPADFNFTQPDFKRTFMKYACTEVSSFSNLPEGIGEFILPEGMYAVFLHRGPASMAPVVFQYIFGQWLPASDYVIDQRPHFELLDSRYKHDSPESEEEIWIPIRLKL